MRRMGELIKQHKETIGLNGGGTGARPSRGPDERPKLAEIGITSQDSSDYQRLAAIPQEEFDGAFENRAKPSRGQLIGPKDDGYPRGCSF
jgi:hypothetical protein